MANAKKVKPLPEYTSKCDHKYHLTTAKAFLQLIRDNNIDVVAVDTETYYDPDNKGVIRFIKGNPNNVPFGVSFTISLNNELHSYWITGDWFSDFIPLQAILEDSSILKILHNAKYDMHMFKNISIDLINWVDTMIMIHLIDEEHECRTPDGKMVQSKSLKNLAFHYLHGDAHEYEDLVAETRRIIGLNTGRLRDDVSYREACVANPVLMRDYACADTEFTYRLYFEHFLNEIIRQDLTNALKVDIHGTMAVFNIERVGMQVNLEYYENLTAELTDGVAAADKLIKAVTGQEFNVQASEQLVGAFLGLGVTWIWYTEKDELRTDDAVMTELIRDGDTPVALLASAVLARRDALKLRDTFIKGIMEYKQGKIPRIHANFNISPKDDSKGGTRTGRISSSEPNLHNQPKDDKRIRRGFVPTKDFIIVEFDYDLLSCWS